MKAVLASVAIFGIGTLVYLAMMFRQAGKPNAAIGLTAVASRTVLNPLYWLLFAAVLFVGWRIAIWTSAAPR